MTDGAARRRSDLGPARRQSPICASRRMPPISPRRRRSTRPSATLCAPPCWRRSRASSPTSMRCRSASTCRRRRRPSAWSPRPMCGSRPTPKESDLAYLKPGAPAVVTIDAYPGREWQATVTSLAPATGTEFSVLPAQNATGNWVKVVQRVPIRARRADAGRRAAVAHRHERHRRDRHRPSPPARRPRRLGAAVRRDVREASHQLMSSFMFLSPLGRG